MRRRALFTGLGASAALVASPAQADPPLRILCIGDSITVGFNSSDGMGYRSLLQEEYPGAVVDMAAQNGFTLDQIRPLVDAAVGRGVPSIIVVNLGSNDFKWSDLNGWPERLRDLVAYLLSLNPNMKAVVACPVLQPGYEQKFRNCNVWIRNNTVAPLGPRARVVPFDSIPNSFLTDGVHPGDMGYTLMLQLLKRALRSWVPA